MATKKDLIDAQSYSRRRLLAAFTSGAPGGKEVEPTSPIKALIGGVVLAAMVVLGGVFYGFIKPGLPSGWESNTLVMVRDTGARYLSLGGTLHPVLNATSARLLTPADDYSVVTTDSGSIADAPIGPGIGIVGAPDDVPVPDALVDSGWTACANATGTAVSLPGEPTAQVAAAGTVVVSDGLTYVVAGGYHYAVAKAEADAVLRAVGLAEAQPIDVDSRWLNLFEAGTPLGPLTVDGAGEPLGDSPLVVGNVVHPQGSTNRFLVTQEGELAAVSPLAQQLYLLGTGALLGGEREVTPGEIAAMPTASAVAGGTDWPTDTLTPLGQDSVPCAVLQHDAAGRPGTALGTSTPTTDAGGVTVRARGGALVTTGGRGDQAARELVLVDESGTAYPLPGADAAVLSRLGYDTATDVSEVPRVWMQFFASGPSLTVAAAGSTPAGAAVDLGGSAPAPTPSSSVVVDAAGVSCERGTIEYTEATPPALDMLQSEGAWAHATGAGVVVAVVDSGVDARNAHLRGVVTGGTDLVGDGEGQGGLADLHGHGTAIAGLIAAQPVAGSGVVGLAPDASVLSVRVFRGIDDQSIEAGYGPDPQRLAAGIEWAVANGADVISVSLSDDADVPAVRSAIETAQAHGVLVVASAGNRNTATVTTDSPRYPAGYDDVLAVTATDATGVVTSDSIHGPHVEIAAPGHNVLTATTGGGDCMYAQDAPSSSYATGYVAAAAALVLEAHPDSTVEQTRYRLLASAARGNADARDDVRGWGTVQPLDAIVLVPGSGERGPDNPFTGTPAQVVTPPAAELTTLHVERPFDRTQAVMLGAGTVGALALAGLGTLLVLRREPTDVNSAADAHEGLLDRRQDAATQLLH